MANTISSSQIELLRSDNSDNEMGFKIERFNEGSWIEVTRDVVNVRTYTDAELQSAKTYIYRVSAYNGSGNSALSNEATTTTEVGATIMLGVQTSKVRGKVISQILIGVEQ